MKISPQILSIPPYISTSWKNISSLHTENKHPHAVLVVTLLNGARIEVPHLELSMIEAIFTAHAHFHEQPEKTVQHRATPRAPLNHDPSWHESLIPMGFPLIKADFADMGSLGTLLQHNPEQANSPDLPPEVLEKIAQFSKIAGIDDPNNLPKPEPHCNCMRCQIARAIQEGINKDTPTKEEQEEIVSDQDLKFKTWDVAQANDKLYLVTNPLDKKEHYNVYLGEPIGCTCGENQCEHIRAVLNT
jgi:hypothetical protein